MRNRIGVSPMCQYSCEDGMATDWHLVHLGSRAVGGAALVMAEATAVEARGRISPGDLGIWSDAHIAPLARAAQFISDQGAVPAIQLAHAGRKASTSAPWLGGRALSDTEGGWAPVGPSAIPFTDGWRVPTELSVEEILGVQAAFRDATARTLQAGFTLVELHAAHGYLAHSFLSPLSNTRTDAYGGSFENRVRFLIETTRAMKSAWDENLPFAVRLSCSDWTEGGWTIEESVELSRLLKAEGVDLIDCSSGGGVSGAKIPVGPGYQVQFAEAIRKEADIPTAAVGMITEPEQADTILRDDQADMVFLARELLRDPYWPIHAAQKLGRLEHAAVPDQYQRAF